MKNTVQKYLFYLKQQNVRPKKYALQHTLTTRAKYSMWLTNYILNTKKMQKRNRFCILHSPNITPNSLYTLISIYG